MKPQSFIFIGRYGAGKGTQAGLLRKFLEAKESNNKVLVVEPGRELRNFFNSSSYTAIFTKKIVESGGLMPEFMPIYLWSGVLVNNFNGKEHLIFDGAARRLPEAKVLESIFPFYNLEKPWVIHLDVHHEESYKRLILRGQTSGRADDKAEEIENRKRVYEADVAPVIEYFRTSPNVNFLNINGVQSIEAVHADIVKAIGLK